MSFIPPLKGWILPIAILSLFHGQLPCTSVVAYTLQFRPATPDDVALARKLLLQQAMNPLGVSQDTLVIAYDDEQDEPSMSVLGFGQIRSLNQEYSELASLYVRPDVRNRGIGGSLVEHLLQRHSQGSDKDKNVCLLTLKPTTKFYEPYGFHVVSDSELKQLPSTIQLEHQAGLALSFVLGNSLVCMVRSAML